MNDNIFYHLNVLPSIQGGQKERAAARHTAEPLLFSDIFLFVLFCYIPVVFPYAVFRNDTAYAGCRINIGIAADDSARVKNGIAADLNVVAEHSAELLYAGLDLLRSVMNDYELLVCLDVGSYRTCAHVAVIAEDRIAYIVVVRCLNVIEEDDVLELY